MHNWPITYFSFLVGVKGLNNEKKEEWVFASYQLLCNTQNCSIFTLQQFYDTLLFTEVFN